MLKYIFLAFDVRNKDLKEIMLLFSIIEICFYLLLTSTIIISLFSVINNNKSNNLTFEYRILKI